MPSNDKCRERQRERDRLRGREVWGGGENRDGKEDGREERKRLRELGICVPIVFSALE